MFTQFDLTRRKLATYSAAFFGLAIFAALFAAVAWSETHDRLASCFVGAAAAMVGASVVFLLRAWRCSPILRILVIKPLDNLAGVKTSDEHGQTLEYASSLDTCRVERRDISPGPWGDLSGLVFTLPTPDGDLHIVLVAGYQSDRDEYIKNMPETLRTRLLDNRVPLRANVLFNPRSPRTDWNICMMRRCRRCQYDLSGLECAKCPECGTGRW